MKSANEIAVELQAQYDYFFAAAILASLGFSVQITVEQDMLVLIFYTVALVAYAISAVSCFYRLQQKPRIYELHAKADDARAYNRTDTLKKSESQAKIFEKKYEVAYWVMCIFFGLGAVAVGATKLVSLYAAVL